MGEGCELPGIESVVGREHRSSHKPSAVFSTGDLSSSTIAIFGFNLKMVKQGRQPVFPELRMLRSRSASGFRGKSQRLS